MPYLGASGDVPGANIKSYRYKQGTDTSTGATSFPAVNKGADELRVYLNGALLKLTDDYTFTTSAVTISPAPADDDEIQIDVYTSMNLADTVSSSDGGNFVGAVTFQAGVKTGSVKAQDGTSAITIADSTGKVTIPGDLEIQGTTTTIDTNVESVDKLEVGANSSDYAVSITQSGAGVGLDINGSELVLDADADTSIHASTDDQIDIKVGGTDKVTIDSTALKTDDIQEKTTDHGVEIDGVTLKDGGGTFSGDVTVPNLIIGDGGNIGSASDTDAIKIDSSGNLLVGKTSADTGATAGFELNATYDKLYVTRSAGSTTAFNRLTSEGEIVGFMKDGTSVGIIGVKYTNNLYISNPADGIGFGIGDDNLYPTNGSGTVLDDAIDIGDSSATFNDIYATNDTIQTSDRNEKQDFEELSEAEQRVAVACKGLMRKFRWKSAVDKKGDDARIHFGIIAQDLKSAFEAEGLDAGRYAMFIHSEWWESEEAYTDDDGVERTHTITYDTEAEAPEGAIKLERMGVRYSELLAFIISAI